MCICLANQKKHQGEFRPTEPSGAESEVVVFFAERFRTSNSACKFHKWNFEIYVSNEQDPGCLGFTGDYDNKIHYKDTIWMFPK